MGGRKKRRGARVDRIGSTRARVGVMGGTLAEEVRFLSARPGFGTIRWRTSMRVMDAHLGKHSGAFGKKAAWILRFGGALFISLTSWQTNPSSLFYLL